MAFTFDFLEDVRQAWTRDAIRFDGGHRSGANFILGIRPACFQVRLTFSVQLVIASKYRARKARAPRHETQMRFIIDRSIASSKPLPAYACTD